MENDNWKDVPGYEGFYKAHKSGKVKSLEKLLPNRSGFRKTKEIIIANTDNGTGYKICSLSKNTIRKSILLHRIIAITFLENPLNLNEVNHKDGNKLNNDADNLEWCTRQQNIDHSWKTKLNTCIGEKHHSSILTNKKVIEIREKYASGNYSYSKLGIEYGISLFHVRDVVKRYYWNHSEL